MRSLTSFRLLPEKVRSQFSASEIGIAGFLCFLFAPTKLIERHSTAADMTVAFFDGNALLLSTATQYKSYLHRQNVGDPRESVSF